MLEADWKKAHSTTTYKVRLYIKHVDYLKKTEEIYNDLVKKYFDILYERQDLIEKSSFNCLSELERLTVIPKTGARKGEVPELYFEQNAPMYLRRAVINQAIGNVKIQIAGEKNAEKEKRKLPTVPKEFKNSTTFYKGMYKDLEENAITLKLFDGTEWKWYKAKLEKFKIPKDAEILSPTIVIHKSYIMAHIPIKQPIEDITPIKYRMQKEDIRVCGIIFPNSDTDAFAVCNIVDGQGKFIKSLFVKGAKEYKNRIKKINNDYHTTILISSHILSEIENMCDRIIIMDNGSIIEDTDIANLKYKHKNLEDEFLEKIGDKNENSQCY